MLKLMDVNEVSLGTSCPSFTRQREISKKSPDVRRSKGLHTMKINTNIETSGIHSRDVIKMADSPNGMSRLGIRIVSLRSGSLDYAPLKTRSEWR